MKEKRLRASLTRLPNVLGVLSLLFLLLAFLDPRIFFPKNKASEKPPSEGVALYLLLDHSGSMGIKTVENGPSRLDMLKEVTEKFIKGDAKENLPGHKNDLIGLAAFARVPEILSPLTLDHSFVLEELKRIQVIQNKELDGSAIGYAIFKTAHLIEATRDFNKSAKGLQPAYRIHTAAIVLVTDGLQAPNPLDNENPLRSMELEQAAAYAKEKNVHLYIINVNPKLASDELTPFRHLMNKIAEETGGKFYMMDGSKNLHRIYQDIDALEKSAIQPQEALRKSLSLDEQPDRFTRILLSPVLIGCALVFLFASILLKTTFLRTLP